MSPTRMRIYRGKAPLARPTSRDRDSVSGVHLGTTLSPSPDVTDPDAYISRESTAARPTSSRDRDSVSGVTL